MSGKTRFARSGAATAIALPGGSAFGGEFVPEIGVGEDIDLSGETRRDTWTDAAAMGDARNMGPGVRVTTIADGGFGRTKIDNGQGDAGSSRRITDGVQAEVTF